MVCFLSAGRSGGQTGSSWKSNDPAGRPLASPNKVRVKSETASKDTKQLFGATLMCLIHSINSNELAMLCLESALMALRQVKVHFDKVYEGEPTRDTIIRRGLPILWISGGPYARAIKIFFRERVRSVDDGRISPHMR